MLGVVTHITDHRNRLKETVYYKDIHKDKNGKWRNKRGQYVKLVRNDILEKSMKYDSKIYYGYY